MTAEGVRVSPRWLDLREPVDAAARALDLVERVTGHPPASGLWVIHDHACGTGSMGRWLAPLLPGPQHWVLHDRDPDLLAIAARDLPGRAADGAAVTVEARRSDITRLHPQDLAGADLVTASALLDMLTADELTGLVAMWDRVGCPILLMLSVVGRVELTPPEPLDVQMAAAFNAHQRRTTTRGPLLGPDAVSAAAADFRGLGREVLIRPSPWRLGPAQSELAAEWLAGWVDAASEQRAELAPAAGGYLRRRLAQLTAGELTVTVDHADLLVLPASTPGGGP